MTSISKVCLLVLLCIPMLACPKPLVEDIDQLEKSLLGSFSSALQAESDTNFFDIRLRAVKIWEDREDGPWMYVEQASGEMIDKPYRQRVYHLLKRDSVLVSEIYTLANQEKYIGAMEGDGRFLELTRDSLQLRLGCDVFLIRTGKDDFEGKTEEGSCESVLRGASYATSEVRIDKWGIYSWDRGFDGNGNQVWGSVNGPYIFEREVLAAGDTKN